MQKLGVVLGMIALLGATRPAGSAGADRPLPHGEKRLERKSDAPIAESATQTPILGTLHQTHTGEVVPITDDGPPAARFSALLADRVTGEAIDLDARLLGLLRHVLASHPGARVELVSGYRSKKLNEMMRKKGHHVASHSQHSLGHAVDFRIVPDGATKGLHPRELEKEIRALGWDGGVGVYLSESDWFVHADVGPHRSWLN